ncbi:hypothetical protein LguiA_019039 [Lonicera macranthoides]
MQWYVVASLLTGILTTLSQSNGGYKYDYATVPFLAEVFKAVSEEEAFKFAVDGYCPTSLWNNNEPVKGCRAAKCESLFSSPIQGYMLGMLSACLSALAGVYTEFLMKKNNDSLYWQNVQLYMFGAILNMARLTLDDFRAGFERGAWWQCIFNGYSITTWLVVLNLGSTGLLVSWLMKYADNIVKVYSTSMAMILTMVLSVFLFNFKPTVQLFLGIVVCMMSLHMYFSPPTVLVDLPLNVKTAPETVIEVSVDRRTDS